MQATSDGAIDSDADPGTDGLQPASITINDDDTVSDAPANLSVIVGNAQLTVQWQQPTAPGTSTIDYFEYRYAEGTDATAFQDADGNDIGGWETVAGGALAANVVIGNLTNGTDYAVQVRAVSAAGNGTAGTTTGQPTS